MNKTQRKRSSLFGDQVINVEDFWSKQKFLKPIKAEFEGETHIKSSKSLLGEFSSRWLSYSYPILYLAGKKKSKEYKCLNLDLIPCKLYEYTLEKSKYPHKLVLRHSNTSFEFYFHDKNLMNAWIAKLRNICLMCDLTSTYTIGNLIERTNLYRLYWTHHKQTGKSYLARVYNLQNSATLEESLQAQIEKQVIINEIKALRAMNHPNIIKLLEVHEFQGRVVMIFEFIGGSSLLKHILSQGGLPEVETQYIMKTLFTALKALQEKQILHRNLKPENIVFDHTACGLQIKLKSFGFSCTLDSEEQSTWKIDNNICTKCGTPGYMAPELLSHKQSTLSGDIFSMGVIMYTCLTGEPMFKGRTAEDIISKNLTVNFDKTSPKWLGLSDNARDLILKMVQEKPSKRPTIDVILRHPFFQKNNEFLAPNTFRPSYLYPEDNVRTKRNSIEEILLNGSQAGSQAVDKALESLIVSPTYFEFSSNDNPDVPEFYFASMEIDDFDKPEEKRETKLNLPKLGLKIEAIKGSLMQIESGERTPTFKVKTFTGNVVDMAGDELDEYSSDEYDESSPARSYKKFYTFPSGEPTPMTQKPIVEKFNTLKGDYASDFDLLLTGRKLPELQAPVRKKLGNKLAMLDGESH